MTFDDILEHHVGEFGPYQKRLYFLACLPAVVGAYTVLLPVFILATPEHRCRIPGLHNDTYILQSEEHANLINMSIPMEKDIYGKLQRSQCNLYDYGNASSLYLTEPNVNQSTKLCEEWVFDDYDYLTAVTSFSMVCGNTILQSHFKMSNFVGALIGSMATGVFSDLFGRKRTFLSCLGAFLFATILQVSVPVFEVFLAMRFVQGFCIIGVFVGSFVFLMEIVGPHYRMFAGIFVELFWCAGLFILVAAAYFIREWTHLMIALFAPCLLFFSFIWLLPESPRWLLMTGKIKEAEKVLKKTAEANGTSLPENLLEEIRKEEASSSEKSKEAGQVWKLFIHRNLLIRTVIVSFNRFALNMGYYGISLNVEKLSGNLFLNFTLSSAVETLAAIIILLLLNHLGRKPLYFWSMVIAAVSLLSSTLPVFFGDESDVIWLVVLVMVSKFGFSAAFDVMYVYASEVFPTSLRNSAMGLSVFVEVIGGLISPYIIDISYLMDDRTGSAFPMLVFGGVALCAGMFSLLLPETRNRSLPETIEDAVKF